MPYLDTYNSTQFYTRQSANAQASYCIPALLFLSGLTASLHLMKVHALSSSINSDLMPNEWIESTKSNIRKPQQFDEQLLKGNESFLPIASEEAAPHLEPDLEFQKCKMNIKRIKIKMITSLIGQAK